MYTVLYINVQSCVTLFCSARDFWSVYHSA